MKALDLLQETLAIRDISRVRVALAFVLILGRGGCRQRLGEEGVWRWRHTESEIGEEDRSTFVSLLSGIRDKLSN